jgi:hypothetical protein
MSDSVSLDELTGQAPLMAQNSPAQMNMGNLKALFGLFLLFMIVVSDFFTSNIIAGFGEKAVQGRSLKTWGVVLQGTFLVIGYVLLLHLTEHHVL